MCCTGATKGYPFANAADKTNLLNPAVFLAVSALPLPLPQHMLTMQDRLIRLLLPVVVYAVLIHPLILTINKAAGVPAAVATKILPVAGFMQSASYSEAWRWWFAHFNIVPGPTW